jgi:hypothetical protein
VGIPKRGKRDGNERPIIDALEKVGATVTPLSQEGVLDLLVGFRGVVRLLEVKDKGGSLTDAQIKFIEKWDGYPLHVVWNVDEALRAIGAIE